MTCRVSSWSPILSPCEAVWLWIVNERAYPFSKVSDYAEIDSPNRNIDSEQDVDDMRNHNSLPTRVKRTSWRLASVIVNDMPGFSLIKIDLRGSDGCVC